jgi:hypothetical protein
MPTGIYKRKPKPLSADKFCPKCEYVKPRKEEFSVGASWCKACHREYTKNWWKSRHETDQSPYAARRHPGVSAA